MEKQPGADRYRFHDRNEAARLARHRLASRPCSATIRRPSPVPAPTPGCRHQHRPMLLDTGQGVPIWIDLSIPRSRNLPQRRHRSDRADARPCRPYRRCETGAREVRRGRSGAEDAMAGATTRRRYLRGKSATAQRCVAEGVNPASRSFTPGHAPGSSLLLLSRKRRRCSPAMWCSAPAPP